MEVNMWKELISVSIKLQNNAILMDKNIVPGLFFTLSSFRLLVNNWLIG